MTDKQQIRFLVKQVEALTAQNALLLDMLQAAKANVNISIEGGNAKIETGYVSGNVPVSITNN